MSETPDVRLSLPNRADNVALVRQAIAALAQPLGLDAALVADLKTAVSEACNNVVLHAYGGEAGPLQVELRAEEDGLMVTVRDQGLGIQPRPPDPESVMHGVGLSLITALTDRVEFLGGTEEGTEVRMLFAADVRLDDVRAEAEGGSDGSGLPDGEICVSIVDGELVAPVLGAVIAILAARVGFSIERLSDAQLLTDAIAAHAPGTAPGGRVTVGVDAGDGELALHVGPLLADGGERLLRSAELPGLGSLVQQLADDVNVARDGDSEQLELRLTNRG